jgi:hypothetical protein
VKQTEDRRSVGDDREQGGSVAALDVAYDQAAHARDGEQLIKRRIRDSELARHRIGRWRAERAGRQANG